MLQTNPRLYLRFEYIDRYAHACLPHGSPSGTFLSNFIIFLIQEIQEDSAQRHTFGHNSISREWFPQIVGVLGATTEAMYTLRQAYKLNLRPTNPLEEDHGRNIFLPAGM